MSNTEIEELPPGPVKKHVFRDGEIEVWAKLAKYVPGRVDRVFTFGAQTVKCGEYDLPTPATFEEDEYYSEARAFYGGDETPCIFYYLETWGDEAATGFIRCFVVWELHELTHWAVPVEDNETDEEHSERWNRPIANAVKYVMEIDEWEANEYEPPDVVPESAGAGGKQADISEWADSA